RRRPAQIHAFRAGAGARAPRNRTPTVQRDQRGDPRCRQPDRGTHRERRQHLGGSEPKGRRFPAGALAVGRSTPGAYGNNRCENRDGGQEERRRPELEVARALAAPVPRTGRDDKPCGAMIRARYSVKDSQEPSFFWRCFLLSVVSVVQREKCCIKATFPRYPTGSCRRASVSWAARGQCKTAG